MHPGADLTPILNALRTIPMFEGLSSDCRHQLARVATIRSYPRGAHLWDEGDAAGSLTVLLRGYVKVQRSRAPGVILRLLGPGDPVGAIALHNRIPYPASAVCLEPVTLLAIPGQAYFDVLARHPEMTRPIVAELARLTLTLAQRLEDRSGQKVEGRIAQLLLKLAERAGRRVAEGVAIDLRLTRSDIAGLTGTTLETASRVMSRWARARLVVTRRGGFLIPAPDALRDLTAGAARAFGD